MSEIITKLDVLDGGIRITNNKRNSPGCIRFNNIENKFEVYTGQVDCEDNKWSNIMPRIASDNSLGLVKIGNNLIINSETGKLDSVSTAKSQIYQHIIHVSPIINDFAKTDFNNIKDAINFIINLDLDKFDRNIENQWIIKLCPGTYQENEILIPPFVSLIGYGNENTIICINKIKLSSNNSIRDLTIKVNSIMNANNIIHINTDYIDKKLDYYHKRNELEINKNNKVMLDNVIINDELFHSSNLFNLINGNLLLKDCDIKISCLGNIRKNVIKPINVIKSSVGCKINITNTDIYILNSMEKTNIIDCQYNDILIKNSNFLLDNEWDSFIEKEFNCIKNLYSNIEIYNSILENRYVSGNIINNIEDVIHYTELVNKLKFKHNIVEMELESPIFNSIKGIKINNTTFKVLCNSYQNNKYKMKVILLEGELFEGSYEDVIVELLYEIKIFNSFLNIENKMEKHYFITNIN